MIRKEKNGGQSRQRKRFWRYCMLLMLLAQQSWSVASSHLLTATIAPEHFNRIAIKETHIVSARGEQTDCEIEQDEETGELYIMPLTDTSFRVFLSTESGDTVLVQLQPTAVRAQNIELTLPTKKVMAEPAIASAVQKEQSVKHVAKSLLHHRVPMGLIKSPVSRKPIQHLGLKLIPKKRYQSPQGDFLMVQLQNRTQKTIALTDWSWLPRSIDAVETNVRQLKARGTATAILHLARGGVNEHA